MDKYLLLIIIANGLIWARSSYGKFTSADFVGGLGTTLEKFASKNPYPFYKDFLQNFAIPNSQIFGFLTLYAEAFAAITLTLISLYLLFKSGNKLALILLSLGLLTGAFLNLIFYFAAGWTSSSTESLNLLMLVVQTISLIYIFKRIRA